jgi:hypothetical protein
MGFMEWTFEKNSAEPSKDRALAVTLGSDRWTIEANKWGKQTDQYRLGERPRSC